MFFGEIFNGEMDEREKSSFYLVKKNSKRHKKPEYRAENRESGVLELTPSKGEASEGQKPVSNSKQILQTFASNFIVNESTDK